MPLRRHLVGGVVAATVALTASGIAAPAAWSASPPRVVRPACHQLEGVAGLSATSAWAVGSSCGATGVERTLVMGWDGKRWQTVPSPSKGARSSLRRVVAISPRDAWAVGFWARSTTGPLRSLVLHWNGVRWTVVTSPDVGTGTNTLQDVAAVSAHNVWAVGYADGHGALVLHWSGRGWQRVGAPAGRSYELFGVSAVSATDVWATGRRQDGARLATLAMHWGGSRWRVVRTPSAGVNKNNFLQGGTEAVSASDVWAVGSYNAGTESRPAFRTLAIHWDGTRWRVVPTPNRGNSDLYGGVSASSAGNVWAVGTGRGATTLTEHWNGHSWSIRTSPNPGLRNHLAGVSAAPSATFAVGYQTARAPTTPLILRWNGSTWQAA